MQGFVLDVLGLTLDGGQNDNRLKPVMDLVLELRQQARSNKDWGTSDLIRDGLKNAGITVKDGKESTSWQ
jgi:cysteinyl-tRNA synthetase